MNGMFIQRIENLKNGSYGISWERTAELILTELHTVRYIVIVSNVESALFKKALFFAH